jgi:xanthine dehydrogenase accessory factor
MHILLQPLTLENGYEPFTSIVRVLEGHTPASIEIHSDDMTYAVNVLPIPSLLVMGAGLDSEPVVNMATALGWRCSVVDHRSAYIQGRAYGDDVTTTCVPADELSATLDLSKFELALVMSHHLVSDRTYLRQLATTDIGYVGLLGPPKRRDRLLSEIGGLSEKLDGRIHAPAGIQLGGRGAGPIAIEIIAEMQQYLATHRGH